MGAERLESDTSLLKEAEQGKNCPSFVESSSMWAIQQKDLGWGFLFYENRVFPCSQGWPGTEQPPASTS